MDEQDVAVRSHGLAIDELGEALASVPALKRVLIFDTCHSGSAIVLAGKKQNPFAFRGAMERFSRAQGVYSLSAAAADELAAEPRALGHSILTYALLAALGEVDRGPLAGKAIQATSGRNVVDVLEWFRYTKNHVPALYTKYVGRPQHIELSGEDSPTFALLRLPACVTREGYLNGQGETVSPLGPYPIFRGSGATHRRHLGAAAVKANGRRAGE